MPGASAVANLTRRALQQVLLSVLAPPPAVIVFAAAVLHSLRHPWRCHWTCCDKCQGGGGKPHSVPLLLVLF